MKRFPQVAVAAIALMASARALPAQLPGIPNRIVETGVQMNLEADYAKPDNDLGGGEAYSLSGGIGFSRFGLSLSVGARDISGSGAPNLESATSYGGRIGMRLIGGGLNPISVGVQVGASMTADLGTVATGTGDLTLVTPGAWVRVSPPLFPIKPWAQVYYVTGDNLPTNAEEARFVIGANLNLLLGFGLHGAYDWGDAGATWGVGAHFTFRIPGVPIAPGI